MAGVPERLPRVDVGTAEQCLVVEHLLEVRHQPSLVHAVPREPASDLVVHPPARHGVQREGDHRAQCGVAGVDVAAQQQVERERAGEFRCATEPAPPGVVPGREVRNDGVNESRRVVAVGRGECSRAAHHLDEGVDVLLEFRAFVAPCVVDGGKQAQEGLPRVVGAAEERLTRGGEEDGHGPAAATCHGLDRIHVDGIDIGAFLAVDLHVDEQRVHHRGDLVVLETLVRHHVAPVARRVTDGEEHRPAGGSGLLEGVVAPLPPVDRVVAVLAEVRRGCRTQPVHAPIAW